MPRKKVLPVMDPGLTQVFTVGDAEMRMPIVEQVKALGYSHWDAGSHKAAVNSFRNGLRAAVVVIAMANSENGRAFAAWINENHPATTVIYASSDTNVRVAGAKYVVPHTMLTRELPRILAYDLER